MVVSPGISSSVDVQPAVSAAPDAPPRPPAQVPGPPSAVALPAPISRLTASSPLDAAFARPLVTSRVTEVTERKVVRERGPSLVAYGALNPEARPVVLVHGMRGSGEELTELAGRLQASGRQVYFFQYDDTGEFTEVNGQHLARTLIGLAQHTSRAGEPLDIVAHSMGGLVTRVAMNALEQAGVPRAGFPSVRIRTLDTPLDGYAHEASWLAWTSPIARTAMRLLGLSGYYDMRGSSAMFEGLYATNLPNVTFRNTAARSTHGAFDVTRRIHDFDDVDRSAIASYLLGGPLPERPRARNYARALEHDVVGPRLREHLRQAHEQLPKAQAIVIAYDTVMPQVIGTHTSFLDDGDFLENLVDAINRPETQEGSGLSAAPQ